MEFIEGFWKKISLFNFGELLLLVMIVDVFVRYISIPFINYLLPL